jgi:protein-S-isoprenylcysteine O-methyltransferase Ste14
MTDSEIATTATKSLIDKIADSDIYNPACVSLILVFLLPFVLSLTSPENVPKNKHPQQSKKKSKEKAKKSTGIDIKILLLNILLFSSLILYAGICYYLIIFSPQFILFHFTIPNFFRVIFAVLAVLFVIAYGWSIIPLPGIFRIYEGYEVPTNIVKTGPYGEIRHPVCFSRSAITVFLSITLQWFFFCFFLLNISNFTLKKKLTFAYSPFLLIISVFIVYSSVMVSLSEERVLRLGLPRMHISYCNRVRLFFPKNWKKYLL